MDDTTLDPPSRHSGPHPAWECMPGLPRFLAEHRGRAILRSHGIRPMTRMLLMCPPGTPSDGFALTLAQEMDLGVLVLDARKVAALDEQGRKARLTATWERMGLQRAVYLIEGVEHFTGAALALLCRLLESETRTDGVVLAVGYGPVRECLSSRFDLVWEASAGRGQ